jgi:S-adenosylmethionine hydrolase
VNHFRYLSFLTDYGLEDGFVAACHGVSARIAAQRLGLPPGARVSITAIPQIF